MNSLAVKPDSPAWLGRAARSLWRNHIDMWRHFARRWYVYVVLLFACLAASHYLGINFTGSVPERLVWLEHGAMPQRGALVVFRFEATGAAKAFNGYRGLKRVKGMPGDRITVIGRAVYVNGELMGTAIERTPHGATLHVLAAGTIPTDHYFISGTSFDSLDSRYAEIGLVRSEQLIARAHTIF